MKIYLTYSASRSVEYCFWKYFFQAIGVWTEERCLLQEDEIEIMKTPQLVLLDKQGEKKITDFNCNDIFICVKKSSKLEGKSIIKGVWHKKQYERNVIGAILNGKSDVIKIETWYRLLDIFNGDRNIEGLWAASWLFHEIKVSSNMNWNQEILEICNRTMDMLALQDNVIKEQWSCRYMKLYCEYIYCSVKHKSMVEKIDVYTKLLEKCNQLAQIEGWNPSLYLLAGKISMLTVVGSKFAVRCLKKISLEYKNSDILYDIGHIYEKVYGNNEKALLYYLKAYENNQYCYRALFKIAIKLESENRWIDAIRIYIEIRNILKKLRVKDSISILTLEYEYKVCRKMVKIYEKKMNNVQIFLKYQKELDNFYTNLGEYVNFKELMKKMFSENNAQRKCREIEQELYLKLNKGYYK